MWPAATRPSSSPPAAARWWCGARAPAPMDGAACWKCNTPPQRSPCGWSIPSRLASPRRRLAQQAIEGSAADAEHLRRADLIAVEAVHDGARVTPLELGQSFEVRSAGRSTGRGRPRLARRRRAAHFAGQIAGLDPVAFGRQAGPRHDVIELAHITRPIVALQRRKRAPGHAANGFAVLRGIKAREMA